MRPRPVPLIRRAVALCLLSGSVALAGGPLPADRSASVDEKVREAFQAAQDAFASGRIDEADRLLRIVLRTSFDDPRAASMLRTLYTNYGLELPVDESSLALIRDQLGPLDRNFAQYQSRHFVVLSNGTRDWTNQRLALLERTHFQYTRMMKLMGLEAIPAPRKMICVLFAEHADYEEFARRTDRVEAPWVAGYYAAASNRIVMYDDATGPSFAEANRQIERLQEQAAAARRQARSVERSEMARAEEHARRVREHADRESARIASLIRAASDAKAVHEAAHLIAFNCGLQNRGRQYPFWLTEGLATNFETEDATGAFGPDRPLPARERDFANRMQAGSLLALADLLVLRDVEHLDGEAVGTAYAQSYALFRYLFRHQREGLGQLFRDIEREPAGTIPASRMLELFEQRFGPVDLVEREWLRFEQRGVR